MDDHVAENDPSHGLVVEMFQSLDCPTRNKYALIMNPLARSIEELLPAAFSNSYSCFVLIRTMFVISSLCLAFLLPFALVSALKSIVAIAF
ncbi:hypothetical protein BUALT_Bualt16G0113400 [Buddleja alternifolia]|uniref:Uncharacterized protein n=1 Tax=Buddleja alternifolia TaxID=168488 RepID=A0AAV6WLG5_9LAMI|nr:hypothetical protein BUALT_Bualt16G0113400 [Buddleja alternifolia]